MRTDLEALQVRIEEERQAWQRERGRTFALKLPREDRELRRLDDVIVRIPRFTPKPRPCLAGDCDRTVLEFGYCHMHLERLRSCGDLDTPYNPNMNTALRRKARTA